LTLNPCYKGRNLHLVWDATVVDTFDPSHYVVNAAKTVSIEISDMHEISFSDFTPCTHAQSNILHIKYADKTYY